MIIGIDCDNVLFPFTEYFVPFAEKQLHRHLSYPKKFNMYEQWNITKNEWNEIYKAFIQNNEMLTNKPYNGAQRTLNLLHNRGHKLIIITHRSFPGFTTVLRKKMLMDTIQWLENNNLYYDDLLFMKDKYLIRLDVLLDDAIHNLNKVIKPTIPIAIQQPWNTQWQGYKIPKFSDCLSIIDLIDFQSKKQ